jgi:ADP-heptose:LPS heptosyltransferase
MHGDMTPDLKSIKKVLIIQFRPFGDVLLSTSYHKALREALPDAEIDYLVRNPFEEVLYKNPHLSNVISFPNRKGFAFFVARMKLILRMRKRRYDLVIDQASSSGSAIILLFSGAKYKLGWDTAKRHFLYNLKAARGINKYSAILNLAMVEPLGITIDKCELLYKIRPESEEFISDWLTSEQLEAGKYICVASGTTKEVKKWPAANFAEVADRIIEETGFPVVLLWAPSEQADADKVASLMKNKPHVPPTTSFDQQAVIIDRCKLMISNEGGINHLSGALNTPAIAIFGGAIPPHQWSLQDVFPRHWHLYNADHCYETDFGITPDIMMDKAKAALHS